MKNRPAFERGSHTGDEWLGPDLVEHVVVPRPFPEYELELLRREHRLLVLEDVFDRDPRTRRVDPRIDAVSLEELRADQIHEEQVRLLAVFLRAGLQPGGHVHPPLADLFRDDDPEDARVLGADDRGVTLTEDMVPHLLEIPRGPSFGVCDDHRFVDEDRDAEWVKVARADVEVAVDIALHDRGRVVVATEELTGVGDPPVRFPDADDMALLLQMRLDGREPVAELGRGQGPDSSREQRLGGVDEGHRAERGSGEIEEEDAVVPEVRHGSMPEVDDDVDGNVRHVARAERRVRGDEARDARLRLEFLRELHGIRAQTNRELQAHRLRVQSSNHVEQSVRFAHGSGQTRGRAEKDVPRRLAFFFAFDLEPPRRRKFDASLPEGLFRVVHVVLGRRDREDLRARLHPRGRADGRSERGAHAFRDAVRPGPGRDLVLAEHVVRIEAKLQVVRVPGLLRDVPVRRDPCGLEGDVPDLARLRRDEMDLHRELRPRIADVELADPDLRDAAHVLFAGVRLATDFAIHAAGLARHRRGA